MTYPDRSDWSNPWDDKDDRYSPFTIAVMECLDSWFRALEAGTAHLRLPRQDYPKTWTDAQLDNLVAVAIDDYVDKQRDWIKTNRGITTDAHCGLARLEGPQRLALAQDLQDLCDKFEQSTGQPEPYAYSYG